MNAAHTPGPWVVKFQPGKLGMVYVDAQTGFVAPPGAVNVADARLIAAAPDLLLGLSWLVGLHDERPSDANEQMPLALAAARAAIRKATGEQT